MPNFISEARESLQLSLQASSRLGSSERRERVSTFVGSILLTCTFHKYLNAFWFTGGEEHAEQMWEYVAKVCISSSGVPLLSSLICFLPSSLPSFFQGGSN